MNCECPAGYTYNTETSLCEKLIKVDAVLNESPVLPSDVCNSTVNMWLGTAVYPEITPDNFPIIGNSTYVPSFVGISGTVFSPVLLKSGDLWISNTVYNGRLNQAGIGLLPPVGEWQGYSRCITVAEDEVYSVALSSTYGFRMYVDNELAIYYKPTLPVTAADYLHVFPLVLSEGVHNLLFEGLSGQMEFRTCFDAQSQPIPCGSQSAVYPPSNCPNLGAFVAEVYKDVTAQILYYAQDQNDLNALYGKHYRNGIGENITTALLKGSPTDTGKNGNYTCASGKLLNSCDEDKIYCEYTATAARGTCCFILTNCVTGAQIVTNTDLSGYLTKVIKISQQSGCFLVNVNSTTGCPGAIPVTITSYYNTCDICIGPYYKLIDCRGEVPEILTNTDLSEHTDKVIKIEGYNVCWLVTVEEYAETPQEVVKISSFDTCEECL